MLILICEASQIFVWRNKAFIFFQKSDILITTTSSAPNVARVGLTPRRAFNKLKPKNTTAVTAKLNSLFHTGKQSKVSCLSSYVVHMQHACLNFSCSGWSALL